MQEAIDGNTRFRQVARSFLLVPMMLTPVVMGLMWKYMFNPENGIVNWLLGLGLMCAIIVTILRIISAGIFEPVPESDQQAGQRALPVVLKHFFEQRGLTPPGWLLRWAYLAGLPPIERSFITVYRSLHWLDEQPDPAQTPAEAAAALARRLPKVSKEIDTLLQEYQNQLYSQTHGRILPARSAAKVIRQEAARAALQQRWRTLRGIFRPDHS